MSCASLKECMTIDTQARKANACFILTLGSLETLRKSGCDLPVILGGETVSRCTSGLLLT